MARLTAPQSLTYPRQPGRPHQLVEEGAGRHRPGGIPLDERLENRQPIDLCDQSTRR
jgi:hypothetical protein